MRWTTLVLLCCTVSLNLPAATPQTDNVQAEPNLEKRSALALNVADDHLGAARTAYEAGKLDEFKMHLDEVGRLADLSYQSLQDSGKRARKSPRWFKHAEQKLLAMLRRMDSLAKDVTVEDKTLVESVQKKLRDVHDQLLQDIMSRK